MQKERNAGLLKPKQQSNFLFKKQITIHHAKVAPLFHRVQEKEDVTIMCDC